MANTCKVLEKVNAALAIAGHPLLDDLPKGYKASSGDCPLANALKPLHGLGKSVTVGVTRVSGVDPDIGVKVAAAMGGSWEPYNRVVELPRELSKFVTDFDAGLYSRYDANYRRY